jgi:hypothetical protein
MHILNLKLLSLIQLQLIFNPLMRHVPDMLPARGGVKNEKDELWLDEK